MTLVHWTKEHKPSSFGATLPYRQNKSSSPAIVRQFSSKLHFACCQPESGADGAQCKVLRDASFCRVTMETRWPQREVQKDLLFLSLSKEKLAVEVTEMPLALCDGERVHRHLAETV